MAKKRTLVAGGAGFVGSHLCEYLLKKGHEVICLDNFRTGHKKNIKHLVKNPDFEILRHDISFPLYIEADEIYNMACPAAPKHYQKDPVYTVKINVLGTINLLGIAKRIKIPIVHASSSEIYGDPDIHPQKETYWGKVNPVGPRACYDEGKRCAETLCFEYTKQLGLDIKIVRIFNTYGPRMAINDGRVVSNFIIQALTGKPITIYGTGWQTRSFQYIDDLLSALTKIMDKKNFTGPVNIGNPAELRIIDLAKKIINMTGSKSKIKRISLPENDPKYRQPDISLAKKIINWEPKISLTEGLNKTIAYFKKILDV